MSERQSKKTHILHSISPCMDALDAFLLVLVSKGRVHRGCNQHFGIDMLMRRFGQISGCTVLSVSFATVR